MGGTGGSAAGRARTALYIAWRNLTGERRRWAVSAAALAVAAMLVIFLEGTTQWVTASASQYVDHTRSQLIVAEKGIDDLLFAQSAFPATTLDQVGRVSGVAAVTPIVGINGVVSANGAHVPVYVVGFVAGAAGGPWQIDSGSANPRGEEAVLDRGFAGLAGVHIGGAVTLFGHSLQVVGISDDTDAAGDFFVFVPVQVAEAIAGAGSVSYGLVQLAPSASSATVVRAIDAIPGVHALPTSTVAANDLAMVSSSFAAPIQVVGLVGLIASVLIAGIVLYAATVEHQRDYAVMKAVGASRAILYGSALLQSLVLSVCGALVGWGLAAGLAAGLDRWDPVIESQLDVGLVLGVAGVILVVNLIAALLPIRYVSRIDPQEVFKA